MKGMAYFFRNVENIDELERKTYIAKVEENKMQRFRVIEKVCMGKEEYLDFQKIFMKTQTFIKDITYKLIMTTKGEYICVLVLSKEFNYGILVNSSGYSYARTVAIIELGEDYEI